jgi:hypothetical protein
MPFLFWATLPFALMDMWFREYKRARDQAIGSDGADSGTVSA